MSDSDRDHSSDDFGSSDDQQYGDDAFTDQDEDERLEEKMYNELKQSLFVQSILFHCFNTSHSYPQRKKI